MANRWLMLLYQMPTRPSTQRVYVWRRLKACGVAYLQNSVCLLPDRGVHREEMEKRKAEIEARRGEARLLTIELADASEDRQLRELFRGQSDEDYQEFLGQCRDLHTELAEERAKRHFTFAELDENEAEIEKLRAWLRKIQHRDFFKASLAAKANDALAACERDFAKFGEEVAARSRPASDHEAAKALSRSVLSPSRRQSRGPRSRKRKSVQR